MLLQVRRRQIKNRTSAKGSSIRKRHQFGTLAVENEQLAQVLGRYGNLNIVSPS